MSRCVRLLRVLALVEAVSWLLLLGVAMPLKYFAGMPKAVTIVGAAHGVLFVALCAALALAAGVARWPLRRTAGVFGASLVPVVPFLMDGRMRAWIVEADANAARAR